MPIHVKNIDRHGIKNMKVEIESGFYRNYSFMLAFVSTLVLIIGYAGMQIILNNHESIEQVHKKAVLHAMRKWQEKVEYEENEVTGVE